MAATTNYHLKISGMTCSACATRIEKVLRRLPGVSSANINLASEEAWVTTTDNVSRHEIEQAVEKAGYKVQSDTPAVKMAYEGWLILGGAFLTAPLLAPMVLQIISGNTWMLDPRIQLALALPIQFGLGLPFYLGAWRALKSLSGNMDLLVAIGTSAAFALSVVMMSHHQHLYFESAAVIIVLVRLGKWLERGAKKRTLLALTALNAQWPLVAHIRRDGAVVDIPLQQIEINDIAIIRAGERIPADGQILRGESDIDEALITGESQPRSVAVSDRVIGGAINGMSPLEIKVSAVGAETTLARIIRMVTNAQGTKAPIQRLADRISGIFVPAILAIAAITLAGWLMFGADIETALINAVAVLVIACPCALGLATPAAIMVGVGVGARRGILIRDAAALETAGDVTVVAFDKTGTLTAGKPRLIDINATRPDGQGAVLAIATALQTGSSHPLADALRLAAHERTTILPEAHNIEVIPGRGISGEINGDRYIFGTAKMLHEAGIDIADQVPEIAAFAHDGNTISYLASIFPHKRLLASFAFADQLKSSAKPAITKLHALGVRSVMLTGDNNNAAQKIARELNLDEIKSELLPSDKMNAINDLKRQGYKVAMVGDGINDAPALAAADIGLAMATGTNVAIETAGITLMRGDLALVPQAIALARATRRKIKENLAWAFLFNLLGIPLAAFGYLSPIIAGGAMALSSFAVITNALTLNLWRLR